MHVLVTGVAGFIGAHTAHALLDNGHSVVGVDNLNDYYKVAVKQMRLDWLAQHERFRFVKLDIADHHAFADTLGENSFTHIVHLAAQAGVRYSLRAPFTYARSNLVGHMTLLEYCRHLPQLQHFVYASSSSVYGSNLSLPYSEDAPVDHPMSLYAATKRANELMSHTYSHLYDIAQTGLRFFTVYGPMGRPDMAMWIFTDAIFNNRPLQIFNHGNMRRDFTYIDDCVAGILAALQRPPNTGSPRHQIYNIGNSHSEPILSIVALLEEAIGRKAEKQFVEMQPGDVKETFADINRSHRDLGFKPSVRIEEGVPKFVDWFRSYRARFSG